MTKSSADCAYLHQAVMVTPYSEVRPCCRFDTARYEESFIWDGREPLDRFYTGPIFQALREQSRQGLPVAGCRRCYREEELGITSMRQKSFEEVPEPATTDPTALRITNMELAVGRLCNLKCRTCDSFSSTKWDLDAKALFRKLPDLNIQIDLDLISNDFMTELKTLKITGGEPCLHPPFHRLLERLVAAGLAPQIEIEVFSNATVAPPERMISALKHFRQVNISLSVDAVGEQNSYIRHPSDWSKVNSTVRTWLKLQEQFPRWTLGFANTVSVLNILSIFDFLEWTLSFRPERPLGVVFQVVHDPPYLNVPALPPAVRGHLHELFMGQWAEFKKRWPHSSGLEAKIKKVERLLSSSVEGPSHLSRFWEETAALDKLRKESFAAVFPRIHHILSGGTGVEAVKAQ